MANPTIRARGRLISLNDLPMTVFATSCGHGGKDRAIVQGDWMFCAACQARTRVTAILASRGGPDGSPPLTGGSRRYRPPREGQGGVVGCRYT